MRQIPRHGDQESRVIPANEYRRMRWSNGAGWTREICTGRLRKGGNGDWDYRLSIAEIESEAAYSRFPGIDREHVLLHGNGLRLRFDDGEECALDPPHTRLRFAGERGVTGAPVDGTAHAFNLMWRRDALQAELLHRPLVGSMFFFAEPGTHWALHLIAGQARFREDCGLPPLWAGDTALLSGAAGRRRYMLDGGGELLAIRLLARD
ncbi:hypothetical protein CSC70_04510 [Pseudoxanthomonas kalamensis DSM 18571]|uniref:HutD/Ves family protein n=1 Tax=Pseudoxanthomonas kalamensis TaxID=289483 RepID=UPI0013915F44|nr:HutD family protein [Pseudoxanthomonas kalamensis]KAF1711186.1 hypothetical protein CSC70_04510 [Pseudoxanthomonas kalamensis DSM 18571]